MSGHADNVNYETYDYFKNKNKNIKICQWFLDPVSKNGPDYLKNKNRFLKNSKIFDANFITSDPNSLSFKTINSFLFQTLPIYLLKI